MSLSFPPSAFVGQVYNGFTWDGVKWTATPFSTQPARIQLEVQLQNTQSVTANAFNIVKYDTIITDLQSAYNPATGVFTPKQAGVYSITANYAVNVTASGQQAVIIMKNGAATNGQSSANRWYAPAVISANIQSVSALIYCNGTTDNISVEGLAPATVTSFNSSASAGSPVMMIATLLMVGPAGPPGGVSSGNLVLLSKQTVTTPVAFVAFNSLLTSQYDDYEIHLTGLQYATTGMQTLIQVSTDGGATWQGGTLYNWGVYYIPGSGAAGTSQGASGGSASWQLGTATDLSASYNFSSRAVLFRPIGTLLKLIMADSVAMNTANGISRDIMGGSCNVGTYNSFRVIPTSGNITAGEFSLFGKVR